MKLTDEEWAALSGLPTRDIVDLAADLNVLAPPELDRRELLQSCVPRIVARAREEGLPFSKYDRDDLLALPPEHLAALAKLQGLPSPATVDLILKAGRRVYKHYRKNRPHNPVALTLPLLLRVVARTAAEEG